MQFDAQRAFPYPVLRPESLDYSDGEFQVSVDFEVGPDSGPVVARIVCHLSVDEISRLIEVERACFAVIVACRQTFVRHVEKCFAPNFEIRFPPGHLRGEVEIYPFVVATSLIDNYQSPLLNEEWGNGPFCFDAGSILAADEPQIVYVDRDLFRPITSIFCLVKNDNIQNNEWHVSIDDDTVRISVSPANKEVLDRVRNTDANRAVLINSIYYGAVMQCIRYLKAGDVYEDYRWAKVIRTQLQATGVDVDAEDEYLIAQKLLRQPLGLLNAYAFTEER